MGRVMQTILHDKDPLRQGNCFAACVATALNLPLSKVPHFVEYGQLCKSEKIRDEEDPDTRHWYAMFLGFCAGHGVWPEYLATASEAQPWELVFVAGKSSRDVYHQVLYLDGELWHDPHPSQEGVNTEEEFFVLRPLGGFDHVPTPGTSD